MANNVYIGSRYVPIFLGDWNAADSYEPLSIVLCGNNSYTSKRPVPAGTLPTNTTYWALTGNYNGQIAQLQNDILSLDNRMDTAETEIDALMNVSASDVIFIGDSYGLDAAVGGSAWATILEASGWFSDATFLIEGGTGFSSTRSWQAMLSDHVSTLTDDQKKSVKQIVIAGGANDGNLYYDGTKTLADIKAAIYSFVSYVKNNLPNAVIKCMFIGWYRNNQRHVKYLEVRDVYAGIAVTAQGRGNYAYYEDGENIMKNNAFIENVLYIHPTPEASQYLASAIGTVANDGNYKFSRTNAVTLTPAANITIDNMEVTYAYYDGDECEVTFIGKYAGDTFMRVQLTDNPTFNIGGAFVIADLDGSPVGGLNPSFVSLTGIYYTQGETDHDYIPITLAIQNNQLLCKLHAPESLQISTLLIPWFTFKCTLRHS